MKTKKTIDKFIYEGLDFPIELHSVEMVMHDGEWHPKIDVKKIADAAMKKLVLQEERLTGNQIKFIRTYFAMTLRGFAEKVVHESHTAVSQWERLGNNTTNMDFNIEKMLRLYAYDKIFVKTTKQKAKFYEHYKLIQNMRASKQERKSPKKPVKPLLILNAA